MYSARAEARTDMYENIIVGYDGSDYSKAAFKESAAWIKRHGGKATLVHGVYFDEEEFGIAPIQHEKRVELGKKVCYIAAPEASERFGIEADQLVCEGEPPDVIVNVATGRNADLIALGTHGRRGLKRLIMGSVTSKVIMDSPCDVLVVKRPCSDCGGRFSRVLVPYDGSEFSKKALERACRLAGLDGSEVTALYVIPRYEEMGGYFKTASVMKSLNDEAEKILQGAREIASKAGVELKTEVRDGVAADIIVEEAAKGGTDLIIMGSHGWRGFNRAIMGSTAERVIMTGACPILVAR